MHGYKNDTSKSKGYNNTTNMVGRNGNRFKINESITNNTKLIINYTFTISNN